MNVQVVQLSPIPVVMSRHRGPYEELGAVFEKLWQWVTANNVEVGRTIGIYWDNPDFVSPRQLRSAACVEVATTEPLPDNGSLPLERSQLAGGAYATMRYVGPYEEMAPVWTDFTNYIEGTLRRQIREDDPAFEVYVNDPSDTPPDKLITELYMPLI